MNNFPSRGLIDLTREVLKCLFSKDRCKKLTSDHMEVLSAIVLRHLGDLSAQECYVLTQLYGVGWIETKPLETIGEELGITTDEALKIGSKALKYLEEAAQSDLCMTMFDIEYSDKEQS